MPGQPANVFASGWLAIVRAGIAQPPQCPWGNAFGGLIVGSERFAQRIRRLLGGRPADPEVPQLARLRSRPSLEQIVQAVTAEFGVAAEGWAGGSRSDDASRAVAAYLGRRQYGYSAAEVARALGYRGHSSVNAALARVASSNRQLLVVLNGLVEGFTND